MASFQTIFSTYHWAGQHQDWNPQGPGKLTKKMAPMMFLADPFLNLSLSVCLSVSLSLSPHSYLQITPNGGQERPRKERVVGAF
jgi:hypothetical protein